MPLIGAGLGGLIAAPSGLSKPGSPALNGHDLATGVLSAWPMTEGAGSMLTDIVGGRDITLHNSPSWGDDATGKMVTFAASSAQDGTTANDVFSNADLADGAIVLVCRLPVGAATGNVYLASIEGQIALRLLTSTHVFAGVGGTNLSAGSLARLDDTRMVIVVTWQDRTSAERYIDGEADGSCTPASAVDVTVASRPFAIAQFSNGSGFADMRLLSAYLYGRHLSQAEAQALTVDPWVMLR